MAFCLTASYRSCLALIEFGLCEDGESLAWASFALTVFSDKSYSVEFACCFLRLWPSASIFFIKF